MRLYQIISENKDYSLAKKLFNTLSDEAKHALSSWEFSNWDSGELSKAFETNSPIAQEIESKFEKVRDAMKQRYGKDTITLYRGILPDNRGVRAERKLYSWTSDPEIAKLFAGKDDTRRKKDVKVPTDKEISDALERYEKTGFTTFYGYKYKKSKNNPKYYDIYDRNNQFVTDGDNLEKDLRYTQKMLQDTKEKRERVPGRVVKKEIPIDDIIWVLMGGNANEYIVKGHPE